MLRTGPILPLTSRESSIITHFGWNYGMSIDGDTTYWYKVEKNWLLETSEILRFQFWLSSEQKSVRYDNQTFQRSTFSTLSAIRGKNLANLTMNVLRNIRNNYYFLFFFEAMKKTASKINQTEEVVLRRKQKRLNHLTLIQVEICETGKEANRKLLPITSSKSSLRFKFNQR